MQKYGNLKRGHQERIYRETNVEKTAVYAHPVAPASRYDVRPHRNCIAPASNEDSDLKQSTPYLISEHYISLIPLRGHEHERAL
jgi:hypothetical protein